MALNGKSVRRLFVFTESNLKDLDYLKRHFKEPNNSSTLRRLIGEIAEKIRKEKKSKKVYTNRKE